MGEWVRYLVQKGQQWSAVRPGLDLKLAHGQCSRQNVQTQLVGPLATWEGKLSPKKCQESQQPTSPLNSTQLELDLNFLLGLANYKTKQ